jgi:hypothetical protein
MRLRCSLTALAVLLLCILSGQAFAQGDTDLRTDIEQLASPDYGTREDAMRRLMVRLDVTRPELAKIYADAAVPEIRHRLRRVAEHHTIREAWQTRVPLEGPGSLGVVLQVFEAAITVPEDENIEAPQAMQPGAFPLIDRRAATRVYGSRVLRTLPGFPAHAHLQIGDLIIGVDDKFIPVGPEVNPPLANDLIRRLITEQPAGAAIKLVIVRNGKWLRVPVTLASYKALEYVYPQAAMGPRLQGPEIPWEQIRDAMFPDVPPVTQ